MRGSRHASPLCSLGVPRRRIPRHPPSAKGAIDRSSGRLLAARTAAPPHPMPPMSLTPPTRRMQRRDGASHVAVSAPGRKHAWPQRRPPGLHLAVQVCAHLRFHRQPAAHSARPAQTPGDQRPAFCAATSQQAVRSATRRQPPTEPMTLKPLPWRARRRGHAYCASPTSRKGCGRACATRIVARPSLALPGAFMPGACGRSPRPSFRWTLRRAPGTTGTTRWDLGWPCIMRVAARQPPSPTPSPALATNTEGDQQSTPVYHTTCGCPRATCGNTYRPPLMPFTPPGAPRAWPQRVRRRPPSAGRRFGEAPSAWMRSSQLRCTALLTSAALPRLQRQTLPLVGSRAGARARDAPREPPAPASGALWSSRSRPSRSGLTPSSPQTRLRLRPPAAPHSRAGRMRPALTPSLWPRRTCSPSALAT